jgi:hypothetical protein
MRDPGHKIQAVINHRQPFFCRVGADEERNLIAEALLGQEPLAGNDLE